MEAVTDIIFLGSKITVDGDCSHGIRRQLLLGKKAMTSNQSYGFSSSCVWMWELDHKEGSVPNNRCFWTVVLEKTLESSLNCMEIEPINPKGNQPWIFIGRSDAEAEAPILWSWCEELTHWIRPWCWERLRAREEGATEDKIVGWHHWLNEHEFEQTLGDSEGQGSLVCCNSWGPKEPDMT